MRSTYYDYIKIALLKLTFYYHLNVHLYEFVNVYLGVLSKCVILGKDALKKQKCHFKLKALNVLLSKGFSSIF